MLGWLRDVWQRQASSSPTNPHPAWGPAHAAPHAPGRADGAEHCDPDHPRAPERSAPYNTGHPGRRGGPPVGGGTFGESNWVRNLRAAGEATLGAGRRSETVRAAELTQDEKPAFFRDVMKPFVRGVPMGTLMLGMLGASDILQDPNSGALRHPVFELHRS